MKVFNTRGRTYNAMRSSVTGFGCRIFEMVLAFVYRLVFVRILSVNYLGINGLFTNILQVLALSELGITSAVTFRFYKPISENDTEKVGELLGFFKKIYHTVAIVITTIGLIIAPFINFFILDTSEIPQDINIYYVYILFLVQSVSTYLFSYKTIMLTVDQKQYSLSLYNSVISLVKYIFQLIFIYITHKYVSSLIVGIAITLISNMILSATVEKRYPELFRKKGELSKPEKRGIISDAQATLCHKIGGTVLFCTDNLIISKFLGLAVSGIFSNYTLIITSLQGLINQIFGSFTSSIGNANTELLPERKLEVFNRLQFAIFWFTGVCSVCLFTLVNDFVGLWIGRDFTIATVTVCVISVQFFFEGSRAVLISFTNGCGLFTRDKIRPIIESAVNIIVSVILVKLIGAPGVFIGTVISHLVTVFWREPYLLFKYVFNAKSAPYWKMYAEFSLGALIISVALFFFKKYLAFDFVGMFGWLIEAAITFISVNLVYFAMFFKTEEFRFYKKFIKNKIRKGN